MEAKFGVINVYKEAGYTSHDVVAIMRKKLGIKKIGHTGTLDPAAQGVLPICIGRATKFTDYITAQSKTYIADLVLGVTTDTGDTTGKILTSFKDEINVDNIIEEVMLSFKGEITQTPPMYSAVKVNGKKLYDLARKGITVERKPRLITIHEIKILNKLENGYRLYISCSKGTYIRSLCTDIGEKLGCGGTMGNLIRTRSGQFKIEHSIKLEQINESTELQPIEQILQYPTIQVLEGGIKMALNGNPLPMDLVCPSNFEDKCWLKHGEKLIGLYKKQNKLFPEVML